MKIAVYTGKEEPNGGNRVSALLGKEKTLNAYKIAVENKYRFFSFGDAMFIKE